MFVPKVPWWVYAGAGVLVVGSLGLGTTWSYIKTAWRGVGKSIREVTPIAFDLQRLDNQIKDMEPEIRRNQAFVAQLEVELENLEQEIADMEKEQTAAVAEMKKLREALASDEVKFQFGGQHYTRAEVDADLTRRLDRYEARKNELEAKKQLCQERRRHLDAAIAKVNQYRTQYDQLKIKAETLAGQLKLLETDQAAGSITIDQSRLSRAKELSKQIESRIRVGQRMLASQQKHSGEIPVDADRRPAAERFDELFGTSDGG